MKLLYNNVIVGSDEVGTGALAGPIVVCAVAVPTSWKPPRGLRDSKKMRAELRKRIADDLRKDVIFHIEVAECDSGPGFQQAIFRAHQRAIHRVIDRILLSCTDDVKIKVVIDGNILPYKFLNLPVPFDAEAVAIPKADDLVPAVSAASVIAKVHRDELMEEYAKVYPEFGFEQHKGYPSPEHKAALTRLGPCEIHRKGYGPVREAEALHSGKEVVREASFAGRRRRYSQLH